MSQQFKTQNSKLKTHNMNSEKQYIDLYRECRQQI